MRSPLCQWTFSFCKAKAMNPMEKAAVEYHAIVEHNTKLLVGAENAIAKLKQIPASQRTDLLVAKLDHWKKIRSALRWSLGIAKQRYRRTVNVN